MKTEPQFKEIDLQSTVNPYEPPAIEIMEVKIEKGFAASVDGWNPDTW